MKYSGVDEMKRCSGVDEKGEGGENWSSAELFNEVKCILLCLIDSTLQNPYPVCFIVQVLVYSQAASIDIILVINLLEI